MLYQTHIVSNMARPISQNLLDRKFNNNSLNFELVDFLKRSIDNGSLPEHQHPLDNLYVRDNKIHLIFTWVNKTAAEDFIKIFNKILPVEFLSAALITLDEDLM